MEHQREIYSEYSCARRGSQPTRARPMHRKETSRYKSQLCRVRIPTAQPLSTNYNLITLNHRTLTDHNMHLNTALALAVSVLFVGTSAVPTANKLSPPFYDSIADRRFHRLEHKYTKAINKVLKKNGLDANCTADNVQRRKQW